MLLDLLQGDPLLRPPLQAPLNQVLNHHSWYFTNPDYGKVFFFGFTVKQNIFYELKQHTVHIGSIRSCTIKVCSKKIGDPDFEGVFFGFHCQTNIFYELKQYTDDRSCRHCFILLKSSNKNKN
jgi:hypothetical protein